MWTKREGLLGQTTTAATAVTVRFWGVRGSIACPGPETQKYGGNTSCIEVRCGEKLFILDAGSGLRYLGEKLKADGKPVDADLLLSHTHMDHVCGLPFFGPFHCPDTHVRIWSGHLENGWTTSQAVDELMAEPLFPVSKDIFKAHVEFADFEAGDTLTPSRGVTIRTAPLNHPNGATGYRIECGGKAVCYVTDTEHYAEGLDQKILDLIGGADVFIYDSSYTDEEYPQYTGYGHSTWQEGARLARAANVKQFVAFHHDPSHDDAAMDKIARELKKVLPAGIVAREGLVLKP
jgi:phosphoribosyl 1,2-cyclic phosphodiesterase